MSAKLSPSVAPGLCKVEGAADRFAETIPAYDTALADKVSSNLAAVLVRLHAGTVEALIRDEEVVHYVSNAVLYYSRHAWIARTASEILRRVCGAQAGRNAVFGKSDDGRTATLLGLLAVATVHSGDAAIVAEALGALALLVADRTTMAWQNMSEARFLVLVADLLQRHADKLPVTQQALRIMAAARPPDAVQGQLAKAGFTPLVTALLEKHMDVPSVAHDAAAVVGRLVSVAPLPRSKAADLTTLLMAAVHRYDDAGSAAECARAGVSGGAVIGVAMRALSNLALDAPVTRAQLAEGSRAFQLLECMRRHAGDAAAAGGACELLSALAQPASASSPAPSSLAPIVLADAVPLVMTIMEAHEADDEVLLGALAAFTTLGLDPATRLLLAQEAPVRLLLKLLRRRMHCRYVVFQIVIGCISAVAKEETGRAALMDGGAAPETLGLLLEAARTHNDRRGDKSMAAMVMAAIASLCCSYDRYIAAHEAGVPAAALAVLQVAASSTGDELAASQACTVLSEVARYHAAREDLFAAGAPAAALKFIRRYSKPTFATLSAWAVVRRFFEDRAALARQPPLVDDDALPLMLASLRELATHACGQTVKHVASCLIHALAARPAVVRAALAAAVPTLLRVLRAHAADVHAVARVMTLLASFAAVPSADGAGALAKAKGLPDVLAALAKHGADSEAAGAACSVIACLAAPRCPDGVAELGRAIEEVLPAVAHVLRHHIAAGSSGESDSGTVADAASCALLVVSETPSNCPHFARGGVIPALLGLLKRYADGDPAAGSRFAAANAAVALCRAASAESCLVLMRTLKTQDVLAAVLPRVADISDSVQADARAAATQLMRLLAVAH